MENDEKYLRAKRRVENLKAFYIHLTVYILVNLALFIINFVTSPNDWWFFFPLMGWGVGIVAHGISVFASGTFGQDWEDRKIKEYMEKDKRD